MFYLYVFPLFFLFLRRGGTIYGTANGSQFDDKRDISLIITQFIRHAYLHERVKSDTLRAGINICHGDYTLSRGRARGRVVS